MVISICHFMLVADLRYKIDDYIIIVDRVFNKKCKNCLYEEKRKSETNCPSYVIRYSVSAYIVYNGYADCVTPWGKKYSTDDSNS